jgi:hypothetical protein
MITAGTIVGKIAELIVTKSVTRIGSLALGKRRKACRSLTKLYYCVSALDEAADEIIHTFEGFRSGGVAYALVNALNNHMHEVAYATDMFVDLGYELEAGLEIIDPALAITCHTLYRGKYDFLMFMSTSIAWDRTQEKARIVISAPTGAMDAVDLDAVYTQSQLALGRGEKLYWPESALDDFKGGFETVLVEWQDDVTAENVHQMLVRQKAALGEARENLRALLAEKFKIEEILFQSDTHPYR